MASLISNEKYSLYFQKVSLLYKKPEIRASLEIILSVFTVTILILVAIRPTLINITQLQKKIEDQETVSKKEDIKIGQLLNAQKQLDTYRNNLRLFDEAVPDIFSYTDGAKRIEYLAKKNGLLIESLSFPGYTLKKGGAAIGELTAKLAVPDKNNIVSDEVTFSVNGKPQEVISFLREIENMDRLATLNNVSLAKQIGVAKVGDSLKASGKMIFYFYTEKQ